MDLVTMESFATLCKYGNYTRAAEQMYISQSALSKRISALEIELGMQIIERSNSGFSLTLAGRDLLEKCEQILQLRFEMEKRMKDIRDGIQYTLKVAIIPEYPVKMLGHSIAVMSETHPEVELQFVTIDPGSDLMGKIMRNEYDVLIAIREDFEGSPGVTYRIVKRSDYAILASKAHPYYSKSSINGEDLLSQQLVLYSRSDRGSMHTVARYYESCGYDRRSILFTADRECMIYYVCTGKYLGLGGMDIGGKETALSDLIKCIPFATNSLAAGDIAIGYRQGDRIAESFADIVIDYKNIGKSYGSNSYSNNLE